MFKAAVLGASGYTGADLLRIGARHPQIAFKTLIANTQAGKRLADVFPHLGSLALPDLQSLEEADFQDIDVVFCGLPHGASQAVIKKILGEHSHIKIIDMGADYRLRDTQAYEKWYGAGHVAPELQVKAAYGLTELNRASIATAPIIACPGCYPTAALLALLPLVESNAISVDDIIIDAKSGLSGAGRSLVQGNLFSEVGESLSPYKIGAHRHTAELEQELGKAAGKGAIVNFTPHLVPMSRGELVTIYVKLGAAEKAADLRHVLDGAYGDEQFVRVAGEGAVPSTAHVRGSNHVLINAFDDRIPGRAIIVSAIDNLVKGSAGQAIQNFNLAFGLPEGLGLEALPLFP